MSYILLFYLAFFTLAMVLPTLRVYRRTGINPLVLPSDDSVEGFVGLWFKLLIAALGTYLLALTLGWLAPIGPISLGLEQVRIALGWGLLLASLAWVVLAQWQMGNSWRIGIDAAHRTELVASGLFRWSRNPIFLGMIAQLLGLFLLQPDAITLLTLICGFVLISVQIRLEEAHLAGLHGDSYRAFAEKVRRWI